MFQIPPGRLSMLADSNALQSTSVARAKAIIDSAVLPKLSKYGLVTRAYRTHFPLASSVDRIRSLSRLATIFTSKLTKKMPALGEILGGRNPFSMTVERRQLADTNVYVNPLPSVEFIVVVPSRVGGFIGPAEVCPRIPLFALPAEMQVLDHVLESNLPGLARKVEALNRYLRMLGHKFHKFQRALGSASPPPLDMALVITGGGGRNEQYLCVNPRFMGNRREINPGGSAILLSLLDDLPSLVQVLETLARVRISENMKYVGNNL